MANITGLELMVIGVRKSLRLRRMLGLMDVILLQVEMVHQEMVQEMAREMAQAVELEVKILNLRR